MNPVCLLRSAQAIGSAYSAVTGVPAMAHAIKKKDRENSITGSLTLVQSVFHYLQARASLITGISVLTSRFLSYEFSDHTPIIKPVIGNAIGLAGCAIDAMVESRGIFHCTRFLNKNFPTQAPDPFNQLQKTAALQDPIQKKQERTVIIRTLIKQLEPTPLTRKIESIFEEIVGQETRKEKPRKPLLPLKQKMTYEELEKKIEAATWFSKLHRFNATYIKLTPEQHNKIDLLSEKNHSDDVDARDAYRQRNIKYQESIKGLNLARRVGDSYVLKLQSSIDPLLSNLLSEDAAVQTQAVSDTKKLLENTKIQAEKLSLIHSVGLVSAIITGISFFIALCVTCAPAIPFIIGVIGTIIYVARYLLACELMENEGWQFSIKSSIARGFIIPIEKHLISPVTTRIRKVVQSLFNKTELQTV